MQKILSLAYFLKDDSICLAMKKRGFGEGEKRYKIASQEVVDIFGFTKNIIQPEQLL